MELYLLPGSKLFSPAYEERGAGIWKSDRANQQAIAYPVYATIIRLENIEH
jgi:hypothetical protein